MPDSVEKVPTPLLLLQGPRIVGANRAARELVGRAELVGMDLVALMAPEHRGAVGSAIEGPGEQPVSARTDGPRPVWVEVHCLGSQHGDRRQLVSLVDWEGRANAEARAQAAERLATLGRVVAGVAHEIRNPLTYVIFSLECLQERLERVGTEPATSLAADIQTELASALMGTRMIAELVQLLRVPSDSPGTDAAPPQQPIFSNLHEAAQRAIQITKAGLPISLDVANHISPSLAPIGMALGPITQILINLLANSADAIAGTRRRQGRVDLRAYQRGGRIHLRVQDDGPGVQSGMDVRIFDELVTTKADQGGSGLGLRIVSNLLAAAGGSIQLIPTEQGACFEVQLPVAAQRDAVLHSDLPADCPAATSHVEISRSWATSLGSAAQSTRFPTG